MALARLMHTPISVFVRFVMRQTVVDTTPDAAAYWQRYNLNCCLRAGGSDGRIVARNG